MTLLDSIKIPDLKKFLNDFPLKSNPHFEEVLNNSKKWIQDLVKDGNLENNEKF